MAKKKVRKRQTDPYADSAGSSDDNADAKKCTHLAKGIDPVKLEKSLPAQGQELLHCQTCNEGPEIFICLSCGNRGCGRDRGRHALEHRNTPRADRHDVALSAVSWASWCYECDDWVTVESARLTKATNLVKNRVGPAAGSPRAVQAPTLPPALREKPPAPKEVEVVKEGSDRVLKSLPPVKGLVNLGNTCFFNSVIQVLSQTHWLTQLLDLECREGKVMHLKGLPGSSHGGGGGGGLNWDAGSCSTLSASEAATEEPSGDSGVGSLDRDSPVDPSSPSDDPVKSDADRDDEAAAGATVPAADIILGSSKALTLTLASLVKEMHCPAIPAGRKNSRHGAHSTVNPSIVFSQVTRKNAQFRGFQQQDAHELLRHLLDGVRTEEIARRRLAILQHFQISASKQEQLDVDPVLRRKLRVYGKESTHTFVDQLFGGLLLSTVICESCHHPYQIMEPFMDLSLPVSEDKSPPSNSHKRSVKVPAGCFSAAPPTPVLGSKHQRKKERLLSRKAKGKAKSHRAASVSSCEEALGAVRTVADPVETPTPAVADADPEPLAVPSGDHQMPATPPADQQVLAGSLIEGESPATPPANQEPPADAATTNEEEAAAAAAAATAPADREAAEGGGDEVQGVEEEPQEEEEEEPQEEPELSESADVEDNEETHDDICRRMKELSVHADRLLGEATDGAVDGVAVTGDDGGGGHGGDGNGGGDDGGGGEGADRERSAELRRARSDWISRSLCSLAVRYQAAAHECSVQSCLNSFTAPELLTGSNKYGCDNCTRRRDAQNAAASSSGEPSTDSGEATKTVYSVASKQLLIFAPPALLTLHLKRFTQNGMTLKKVNRHVDFPLRLDLAPFCSAAAAGIGTIAAGEGHRRVLYGLYGVIEHSGRLSGGHYTACVKVRPVVNDSVTKFLQQLTLHTDDLARLRHEMTSRRAEISTTTTTTTTAPAGAEASDGVWYHASDAHVVQVNEERVLRSQAFLLFYERIL